MKASLFLSCWLLACSSSSATPPVTTDGATTDDSATSEDAPATDTAVVTDVASETTAPAATVHVGNWYYKPKTLTVKVGDTVHFVWDNGTHTVTSGASCTSDGKFDSGRHVGGFTWDYKFDTAGTFPIFCDYMDHCTSRGQEGTITVTP